MCEATGGGVGRLNKGEEGGDGPAREKEILLTITQSMQQAKMYSRKLLEGENFC